MGVIDSDQDAGGMDRRVPYCRLSMQVVLMIVGVKIDDGFV